MANYIGLVNLKTFLTTCGERVGVPKTLGILQDIGGDG